MPSAELVSDYIDRQSLPAKDSMCKELLRAVSFSRPPLFGQQSADTAKTNEPQQELLPRGLPARDWSLRAAG